MVSFDLFRLHYAKLFIFSFIVEEALWVSAEEKKEIFWGSTEKEKFLSQKQGPSLIESKTSLGIFFTTQQLSQTINFRTFLFRFYN